MSAWDDPSLLPRASWSPFGSVAEGVHQLKMIARNAAAAVQALLTLQWFSLAAVAGAIALALSPAARNRAALASLLGLIALIAGMYLPILVDPRYLWPAWLLSLVFGAMIGARLAASAQLSGRASRAALMGAFLLASAAYPATRLLLDARDGEALLRFSEGLAASMPVAGARVAADTWKNGLVVAWRWNAAYFGRPASPDDAAALERELLEYDIDYYLAWKEPPKGLRSYIRVDEDLLPFRLLQRTGR